MLPNNEARYGSLTIALHWLMVILIVAVYAFMELRGYAPKGSDLRLLMKSLHFMLGLSILALVFIRIAARFSGPSPAISPVQPPAVLLMAKLMHLALYGFMIFMPVAGWLVLSAQGKPVPFFGLELPPLVGIDKHFAHQVLELHETVAEVGYWLIGLHAVAGLYHHYAKGDNTLTRMLPRRK